ncbi:MAG: Crp/Fnr family transcriptional regulator [Ignavibacteria bacterium]|nr:Crp/Fnr family transcriptional regulator [Ignavibacteria bacterium]
MKQLLQIKDRIDNHYPFLWKKKITLQRNEYLIHEGEFANGMYFIQKGALHVFLNYDGDIQTMRFGYENSFICALDSFVGNCPTKFTIQAIKCTQLLKITRCDFFRIIATDEVLRESWMQALGITLNQHIEREIDLLHTSPVDRYFRLLERSPKVFQEIPSKYIASYLRMAPETLSRLLKS